MGYSGGEGNKLYNFTDQSAVQQTTVGMTMGVLDRKKPIYTNYVTSDAAVIF